MHKSKQDNEVWFGATMSVVVALLLAGSVALSNHEGTSFAAAGMAPEAQVSSTTQPTEYLPGRFEAEERNATAADPTVPTF